MRAVLSVILLFAVLWPHAGVSQTTATSAKISCPQCGVEVKPEASFCPQCGASLPKLALASNDSASPLLATVSSGIDSTASIRQELVRMLLADPEFDRMLTQKIQRAVQQVPASSKDVARYEHKSDPLGGLLKVVGGVVCGLSLIGLLAGL
jgi:zinc-ribbon domain